jgi:hypothetical protein
VRISSTRGSSPAATAACTATTRQTNSIELVQSQYRAPASLQIRCSFRGPIKFRELPVNSRISAADRVGQRNRRAHSRVRYRPCRRRRPAHHAGSQSAMFPVLRRTFQERTGLRTAAAVAPPRSAAASISRY